MSSSQDDGESSIHDELRMISSQEEGLPIVLPFDDHFEAHTNTSRGFAIEDVYHVDFNEEPLAGGGFGTVYRCRHLFVPDMPVAVKQLHLQIRQTSNDAADGDEDEARKRLVMGVEEQVTEIAILKEFRDSPHIIHMYEYFVQSDATKTYKSLYIVTEFLEGGELFHCIAQRNKEGQPFSEQDVRDIFMNLLRALRFMHSKRIIHRDLKPSNLLLQVRNEPTSLKVADFGQSKLLRENQEKTRTCTGTPGYRPPEMYLRQEYNELSDMFPAGVILFFLLAGYQPFSSYPKAQIEMKTIRCEYRQNVESWNRVSVKAKNLVKRLLTRAEYRLSVYDAMAHEWLLEDSSNPTDLTENAKAIATSIREERKHKRELALSTGEPSPTVDADEAPSPIAPLPTPTNSNSETLTLSSTHSLPRSYGQIGDLSTVDSVIPSITDETRSAQTSVANNMAGPSRDRRVEAQRGATGETVSEEAFVHTTTSQNQTTEMDASPEHPKASCCSWLASLWTSTSSAAESASNKSSRRDLDDRISSLGMSMESNRVRYSSAVDDSVRSNHVRSETPDDSYRSGRMRSETPDESERSNRPGSVDDGNTPSEVGQERRTTTSSDISRRDNDQPTTSTGSSNRQGNSRNLSVSFSGIDRCPAPVAFPAIGTTSQGGLTFWDPTFLHVGSDLPRRSKPLISHISGSLSSSEYTEFAARRYCKMIFECVAGLHASVVVHRSITMTNLFVQSGENGEERVILRNTPYTANAVPGERTLTGYCGTPYRATAPEVYEAFSYDEKVDMWSLGVVTYFLLCGIDPFHGSAEDVEVKRRCVYIDYPFSFDAPSQSARSFVELLLQPNPVDRMSAQQALEHEWMRMDDMELAHICLEFAYGGLTDWI